MSNFELFYKLSFRDRDKRMDGVCIKRPKPLAVMAENLVSSEVKFSEKIMYYKTPQRNNYPLDLNVGFESLTCGPGRDFKWKLNKVCFYLMNKNELQESEENNDESCGDGDEVDAYYEIFCHLGLLRALMKTPNADPKFPLHWNIFATFYNNKLYLINRIEHNGMNRSSSYYYKYEQYCFSHDPQVEPDTSGPIDDENKIRYIFCTHLKNFKLVYSTQMNGVENSQKLENLKDVETLQQCRFVQTGLIRQQPNWKKNFCMFKWWSKAHLAAADVTYVGFKTSDGFVQKPAERLLVKHMPNHQRWSPKVCYQFLYNFIKMVIDAMRDVNSPYTCFEFHYDHSTDSINYRIHEGKTEYSFLAEDYIAYLGK